MGCLIVICAMFVPRITLFVLWAFTSVTKEVFEGWFWPFMGFLFMPFTTLAYIAAKCWAENGQISGWWIVLMVVAVLFDIGGTSSSTSSKKD